MYIIPKYPSGADKDSYPKEAVPISMVLENRFDLILVFVRLFRYLGSIGVWGKSLVWCDNPEDTGIYIGKEYADAASGKGANKYPSILVSVGGYSVGEQYLNDSTESSLEGIRRKTSSGGIGVRIRVTTQSDPQCYALTDTSVDILMILKRWICGAVVNMVGLSDISVGEVRPYTDKSGVPDLWECDIRFSVQVDKFFNKGWADGANINSSGRNVVSFDYGRLEGSKPIFTLASFTTLGEDEEVVIIQNTLNFGDDSYDSSGSMTVNTLQYNMAVEGEDLTLHLESLSSAGVDFELVVPETAEIGLPGFAEVYPGRTVGISLMNSGGGMI